MLQAGEPSPDRDEQFGLINDLAKQYLEAGDPMISVDTKKRRTSAILRTTEQNTVKPRIRVKCGIMTFLLLNWEK